MPTVSPERTAKSEGNAGSYRSAWWGWEDSNLQPDRYEPTFPAPQNRELFRPGDRNVEAFEHQELGELGQLDGQQLAAFSAILLSARASARRLASDSSRTKRAWHDLPLRAGRPE